jgi:hypothetical protein
MNPLSSLRAGDQKQCGNCGAEIRCYVPCVRCDREDIGSCCLSPRDHKCSGAKGSAFGDDLASIYQALDSLEPYDPKDEGEPDNLDDGEEP